MPEAARHVQHRGRHERYLHAVRSRPSALYASTQQATLTPPPSHSEDAEFLTRNHALPAARIQAIETGGCPHAAVREDISANLQALQHLHGQFAADLLLIESGGDNLAANYSRELADFIIYVIDVAGGDKVPRKGGPGITGSDLLVVNKVRAVWWRGMELRGFADGWVGRFGGGGGCGFGGYGEGCGEDEVRRRGSFSGTLFLLTRRYRDGGPTIFAVVKHGKGVDDIVGLLLSAWKGSGAYESSVEKWKKSGRKNSTDS